MNATNVFAGIMKVFKSSRFWKRVKKKTITALWQHEYLIGRGENIKGSRRIVALLSYLEYGVRYCRQRPVVGQIGYPEYVNTPFVDLGQCLWKR